MKRRHWLLLLIILLGVLIRLPLLFQGLEGDEAVFGIMARHISEMKEFPIYLWEAHYAGTLSSYIGAVFLKLFGISSVSYRLTGLVFSVLFIFFSYLLGMRILNDKLGILCALFTSICPPIITRFSVFVGGVHAEGLLFGTVILYLLICYLGNAKSGGDKILLLALLGFFIGFGLWLSPQIIPFFATVLIFFLIYEARIFLSRGILVFLACYCLGHAPALLYNFQHPAAFLYRFGGRILDLDRSFLSAGDRAGIVFAKIKWRISTIPESLLRIPRLLLPLMGAAQAPSASAYPSYVFIPAIYWVSFVYGFVARIRQKIRPMDICIVFAIIFVFFYVCLVGEDNPRYMLPLYTVMPVFLGVFFLKIKEKSVFLFSALVVLILAVNIAGNAKMLMSKPVSFSEVVNFLSEKGITRGYSDYSTSYGIIFASDEKIIVSPTLLGDKFDRYPEYTKEVNSARNVAYIFNKTGGSWEPFERRLEEKSIRFNKQNVSSYVIYWDLSERIFP